VAAAGLHLEVLLGLKARGGCCATWRRAGPTPAARAPAGAARAIERERTPWVWRSPARGRAACGSREAPSPGPRSFRFMDAGHATKPARSVSKLSTGCERL
jgi:hypothetical protein